MERIDSHKNSENRENEGRRVGEKVIYEIT